MATKKNIKINENDIIAKSSENYISVKIGCLKFLDSYRFLDASLDKLSTTLKSFPSLDAKGMEDDLFKRKLAFPYEKGNTIESFFKPLELGREDYFSTLKQSYPDFEEIIRTQAIIVFRHFRPKYMVKFNTGTDLRQNLHKYAKIGRKQLKNRKIN